MIISKKLTSIPSMLWMMAATASIAACAGEHVTKNAGNANYVNALEEERTSSATATAAPTSNNQVHHFADTQTELLEKPSQVGARHFAVYARYRQLVGASSGSSAATSQEGNVENRSSGAEDTVTDAMACPDPRQPN